jgi:uncharacterized protein
MNKPATKEPSMDEILSSIRQIIADDDAGVSSAAPPQQPAPQRPVVPPPAANMAPPELLPLALSTEQIVAPDPPVAAAVAPTPPYAAAPAAPQFPPAAAVTQAAVEPPAPQPVPQPPPVAAPAEPLSYQSILAATGATPGPFAEAELVEGDDVEFEATEEPPAPAPAAPPVATSTVPAWEPPRVPDPPRAPSRPVAETAPMPDPTLSADLAERLIEPATKAATHGRKGDRADLARRGVGASIPSMPSSDPSTSSFRRMPESIAPN